MWRHNLRFLTDFGFRHTCAISCSTSSGRPTAPLGRARPDADLLERWQSAWSQVPGILMSQIDVLNCVADYTGFSKEMFAEAFSGD